MKEPNVTLLVGRSEELPGAEVGPSAPEPGASVAERRFGLLGPTPFKEGFRVGAVVGASECPSEVMDGRDVVGNIACESGGADFKGGKWGGSTGVLGIAIGYLALRAGFERKGESKRLMPRFGGG